MTALRASRWWIRAQLGLLYLALAVRFVCSGHAAEVIPPKPARYFNDYAGVVSAPTAQRLNQVLEDFERTTSSQIVVVVFPKMQSDSSVEDYTVRVAQAWQVGQKTKNNGAILFVFIQDKHIYLQVGYGLEGAIPDAIAKQIIEQEIKPQFRAGNFEGGLTAGVNAILQAAKGEYRGTGRTAADRRGRPGGGLSLLLIMIVLFVLIAASRRSQGTVYRSSGRSGWSGWPGGFGGGSWGGGGGGSGGGGSSGGFSSGGGSFGGGGAGGEW